MAMNSRTAHLIRCRVVVFALLLWTGTGFAQQVLMHQMSAVKVVVPYPGLTISVTKKMTFDPARMTPGLHEISKTSKMAGQFLLTGVYNRLPIYMSVKAPKFLVGDADSIRYWGHAAFNDSANNPVNSRDITPSGSDLKSLTLSANREGWTGFTYVYLFGRLYVPKKIPKGTYTGRYEITLIL